MSITKKFLENPILLYIIGLLDLTFGLLLVLTHNEWAKDWTVIITIVGWLLLFKGIMCIIFPYAIIWMFRKTQFYFVYILRVSTVILFVVGVYLTLVGFFPS